MVSGFIFNSVYYVLFSAGFYFLHWVYLQVLFYAMRVCANTPASLITITI